MNKTYTASLDNAHYNTAASAASLHEFFALLDRLSGALVMAATLLLLLFWFGCNMTSYIGKMESHEPARTSTAAPLSHHAPEHIMALNR